MLVTSLCWWHRYVGDFMMVTDFRRWRQNHYVGNFFRFVVDFLNVKNWFNQHPEWVANISNLSSTHLVSNIRHQHRCNQNDCLIEKFWIRTTVNSRGQMTFLIVDSQRPFGTQWTMLVNIFRPKSAFQRPFWSTDTLFIPHKIDVSDLDRKVCCHSWKYSY